MTDSEREEFLDEMVAFVKDTYHNDKVTILTAINEFCLENDIDYEVNYDNIEDDDDVDPTFYESITDEDDLDDE
jgi:hypothetical protein